MIEEEVALVATTYRSIDPIETAQGELDESGLPLEGLCDLRERLDQIAAAARTVRSVVDDRIAQELGENGEVRFGNKLYRARAQQKWKLKYVDQFCAWAGDELHNLVNVPNAVRITSIRQLAKKKQEDESVVLDTFGIWESDGAKLSVLPIDKAPAYAQRMDHGSRNFKKGRAELGSSVKG